MKNKIIKQIIVTLIGLMLCGIGIALFIQANLGVDPASVFQLGLSNVLGISYGSASALMNIVILLIVYFKDKSYINISSIFAIFFIGYTADVIKIVLQNLDIHQSFFNSSILIILGQFIMCVGVATYIAANLGVGAIDMVSELISDKNNIEYRKVRVTVDVTFVIIGYILGGKLGIGTVVCALATGPIVQFVRPYIEKNVNRFIN